MTAVTATKKITIRPATEADYETFCTVWNTVWPEYPEAPAELRFQDKIRDAKLLFGRLMAQIPSGDVVGIAYYSQNPGTYHPQRFHWEVMVLPNWEQQGIGSALYEAISAIIAPYDPLWLRAEVREDKPKALRFVEKRGYIEDQRDQESKLRLSTFDPEAFADDVRRVMKNGITITSFAELKQNDPEFFTKLFEVGWALAQDVPSPEEHTCPPFDVWMKRWDNPNFLWEGSYVARDGNRYVGMSTIRASQSNDDLDTGLTGVVRDYRKRGIASALKVSVLTYAKKRGSECVRTWNEVGNAGMLGINFRLGFVRQPVWISFMKTLETLESK
jgi:GNAT superfamily N-acetyltransferase